MTNALRTMALMMIFSGIMAMQYNLDADRTTNRQLKNALELAVHDAALALDESQLSQGLIVFDQAQAKINFENSLESNLRLNSSDGIIYHPLATSFYQNDFTVEYFEFIDDSNQSFPHNYINPDYQIIDTLHGPGIVVVVSTTSPRYFAGDGNLFRKAVVYEYFH